MKAVKNLLFWFAVVLVAIGLAMYAKDATTKTPDVRPSHGVSHKG